MKPYRKAVPSFLPPEATCSDKSSITLSTGASNRAPTPFPSPSLFPPQLRRLSSSQKWPQQGSPPPAPPPTQLRTLPDRGAAFNLSVLYETPIRPSSKQRCWTSASLAPGHVGLFLRLAHKVFGPDDQRTSPRSMHACVAREPRWAQSYLWLWPRLII